jgi:uncharacterized metal-binding protein
MNMKKYLANLALVVGFVGFASVTEAAPQYEIEAAGNDEKFVIDGELYEAKTYCMGWDEGDSVIFVDGTPGACADATLFNMSRRETCEVWCE